MNHNDIYKKITPIFREVFDDDYLELTPDLSAHDVEEWDSLSHIRLVVSHQIEFGIKFNSSEILELENVGQFVELLLTKLD